MNKTIKVAFGVAGAIWIARVIFFTGVAYGEGLASGMIYKELGHITVHEAMEIAERAGYNPSRNLNDYVYVKGVKEAYKVK